MSGELNLLDFGTNDKGEYVNLVEEEKRLKDISNKEFRNWVDNNDNPLIKVVADFFRSSYDFENKTKNELKEELEWIVEQKVYHYGNMEKGLYIYTLFDGECWAFVFENEKHIMVNLNYAYSSKEIDEILFGNKLIQCNALAVRVYDLKGNRINEYGNKEKDIRYQCLINEWKANVYGDNRMNEGKKIKDFYEIAINLTKLIEYWGESDNAGITRKRD